MTVRMLARVLPFALIAVVLAAAPAPALAGTQEIALAPLLGQYRDDGNGQATKRSTTVILDNPSDVTALSLHLQGTVAPGHAYCDQQEVLFLSALNVSVPDDPGGSIETRFFPAQGGAFDILLRLARVPSTLPGEGWLAVVVEDGMGLDCSTLFRDSPELITVTGAGLVVDSPAAVAASTWGQLKSLYGS